MKKFLFLLLAYFLLWPTTGYSSDNKNIDLSFLPVPPSQIKPKQGTQQNSRRSVFKGEIDLSFLPDKNAPQNATETKIFKRLDTISNGLDDIISTSLSLKFNYNRAGLLSGSNLELFAHKGNERLHYTSICLCSKDKSFIGMCNSFTIHFIKNDIDEIKGSNLKLLKKLKTKFGENGLSNGMRFVRDHKFLYGVLLHLLQDYIEVLEDIDASLNIPTQKLQETLKSRLGDKGF